MGKEWFSRDLIPKIPSGVFISTWVSCCCPEEDSSSCTCCTPHPMPALSTELNRFLTWKGGLLGGTGLPEAADSTVMWNWYLNQELWSHQLEPCRSPCAACFTSEPQSQSTCFEGTSDLEIHLLTTRCVSAPTPKLGLSQHIHPSLCLLSNACGSSFKACSVDRNAKGNGTLLSDQLWVLLPACTPSLRSPGWAQQQDSDTLGCILGANLPRNVTQWRPGEQ